MLETSPPDKLMTPTFHFDSRGLPQRISLFDRIDFDSQTGCWNWVGAIDPNGYGAARYNGRKVQAHRLSAILWLGLRPSDTRLALHRCDNRRCFNPKHIFLGTQSDNIRDAVEKGRHREARKTHCPSGHPYSGGNLVILKSGNRRCKECHRKQEKERGKARDGARKILPNQR